jgi:ribonuclease D
VKPTRRTPKTAVTAPAPVPPPGVRFVERQEDLDALMAELRRDFGRPGGSPLLAVDTEAASFHRYHDRIYLIQLSSRSLTAIVDPLGIEDLGALGELLADPAVEIVFHDADYDLRLFDRQYGFRARNVFDTRIAAQLLNEPGIGLAALLEKYLQLRLDKRFQRADWSARPLSTEMLAYAAKDTDHLPELRDILRARLAQAGRLAWAEEEFSLLESLSWAPAEDGEPGYLRLKGAKALRGRSLAVLRELFEWREGIAKRTDKAAFRIMNNEPMLEMAKTPPTDAEQLRQVKGLGHDLLERRGKDLLKVLDRAMALPESKWPKLERPPRRVPDPAYEARLDRLKAARNRLATQLDLQPGVLCPNGTLEAIARREPQSRAELRELPEIRRWQADEIGEALIEAARDPDTAETPPAP